MSGGVIFIIFVLFKEPGKVIKKWITEKCCRKRPEELPSLELQQRSQSEESLGHISEVSVDQPVHQRIEETEAQVHQPGPGEQTGETTITRTLGETETNNDITTSKEISISIPIKKDDVKKFEEAPETVVNSFLDTAEKTIDSAIETLNPNADINVSIMPSVDIEGALGGTLAVQGFPDGEISAIESSTTGRLAEDSQAIVNSENQ